MRLRLVHQLVLLLALVAAGAVLAVGGFVAWNLRAGFGAYLQARDAQALERFAAHVDQAYELGGMRMLRMPREWRRLLERLREDMGDAVGPPSAQDRSSARGFAPPDGRTPYGPRDRPPPGARPPPDLERFGPRLSLLDAAGRVVAGRPAPAGGVPLRHDIVRDGRRVATVLLAPREGPAPAVERSFLARQFGGLAAVAVLAVAGAVLLGAWAARRWTRPLHAVQAAAGRIAAGELDVRVAVAGSDERADLARHMNAMAASLQRHELARRRWVAESAHELRTPLTVLRGEIEAMLDGVRPLDRDGLVSLQAETAQLTRLVDDLHQLAVADLGAPAMRFAGVDAAALLRDAIAPFEAAAAARGIAIAVSGADSSLPVHWDGGRVGQLLRNLVGNALRYTDPPGRIALAVTREGDALRILVDDSPPGVAPADLPHLFEPLWRADAARTRSGAGSGLGLAIARGIVDAHRGRIGVSASPLGGLRVEVVLPVDARRAAASRADAEPSPRVAQPDRDGRTDRPADSRSRR